MTGRLITETNLAQPDDFFAALAGLHRDLTPEESAKANAKLVLLLANHIGDAEVLAEALALARPGKSATRTGS